MHLLKGVSEDGTPTFHPYVVQQNGLSVLRFLQANCKEDPGAYWVFSHFLLTAFLLPLWYAFLRKIISHSVSFFISFIMTWFFSQLYKNTGEDVIQLFDLSVIPHSHPLESDDCCLSSLPSLIHGGRSDSFIVT